MAVGGHKWLLAPEGCGALFVSSRLLDRVTPVLWGWKSVSDADTYLPYHFEARGDAAKFEPGSQMHLGLCAFAAAIDLQWSLGPVAIEAAVLEVTDVLQGELQALGATILSPRDGAERSGILTFSRADNAALHAALTAGGVVCRQRLGGVRLAPHCYTDGDDVERVLSIVRATRA
jgi:selenocysteine lyase/cysteine desulfurase